MRVGAKEKEKEMGGGQENSGNRARIVWDGEASPARGWKTKGAREHRKGGTPRRGGRSISVLSPVCMAEGHGIDKVSRVHTPFPLLSRPRNYEFLSRRIRLRSK